MQGPRLRHLHSIRFAPPLVISEEDLLKAVDVIRSSLEDLDKVSCADDILPIWSLILRHTQLEDIPGEVESEKGHKDTLTL